MSAIGRMFISTFEFDKQWEQMGLNDDDRSRLENDILDNPKIGTVVQGTGKLRKMHFAFQGKGKSGGIRTLYVDYVIYERIYLITAYPKGLKDDLTPSERKLFKQLIEQTEKELKGEKNE